jgi:hypothetical protein
MRRFVALGLILALLAPWAAALSGVAAPLVPCPMHHQSAGASHRDHEAMGSTLARGADLHTGSHHAGAARGCNCAGECGRSGAPFGFAATRLAAVSFVERRNAVVDPAHFAPAVNARLLPLSTGPPQRLT